MKRFMPAVVSSLILLLCTQHAAAHHSGAMFYNREGATITVTGAVTRFNFANPHAIVELDVTTEDGAVQHWTAETSSPSGLRRRGWSQDSLKPGDTVTLEGYRALDGSLLMRITRVWLTDGTEVGVPPGLSN